MYVSLLEIEEFRGIKQGKIPLSAHTVLLGENNAGKSAIVDALTLVLGRDRMGRDLGEFDFFGGDPDEHSRIKIIATIAGFASEDPSRNQEWFNDQNGASYCWFSPLTDTVTYSEEKPESSTLAVQISFVARFDIDELEVDSKRFFTAAAEDPFLDNPQSVPKELLSEIGYFFVPSSRSTGERYLSFSSDLFNKIMELSAALPKDSLRETVKVLRTMEPEISKDARLSTIVANANDEIRRIINSDEASLSFRTTSCDQKGLRDALTPFLLGKSLGILPLSRHGSGIRSVQILVLLLQIGKIRSLRMSNFILAVEEPELHLHSSRHQYIISRIRGCSNQSVITTHSPLVAAAFQPSEVVFLSNLNGTLSACRVGAVNEGEPRPNAELKLLKPGNREAIYESFMGDVVIVPEGISDYSYFKALLKGVQISEGWSELGQDCPRYLGVFPNVTDNSTTPLDAFGHMPLKFVILVDGDEGGSARLKMLKEQGKATFVVQLPQGWTSENLIGWILGGTNLAEKETLLESLGEEDKDAASLIIESLLVEVKFKTRWDLHPVLTDMVVESKAVQKRAIQFFDALCCASSGDFDSHFVKDDNQSSKDFSVYRLSMHE